VRVVQITAMPNAHSHAFQRLLRCAAERSGAEGNDFWGWREAMYRVAATLDPHSLRAAALAAYRQMRAAGYGAVGEFHYLHHHPDGRPYRDPNAMAIALAHAASEAGIRLVLLPAAYARAGWDGADLPPTEGQRRFCDAHVDTFLDRVDRLREWAAGRPGLSIGIAAHSARAVPADWLGAIAGYADRYGLVRHVHAAEQRREVEEVRAEHGCSPIELLARTGFLGPRASVIHAIHVSSEDMQLLGDSGTVVVTCPTTEGNLGDGWPPAMALAQAGVRLAIGSDSQVRIDPFEEARELDTGARRDRGRRRALAALVGGELWTALCAAGRVSLGLEDEEPGTVAVDLEHPDLEGCTPEDLPAALVDCASAAVVLP
jgi:formimidoylglutamate deiminase